MARVKVKLLLSYCSQSCQLLWIKSWLSVAEDKSYQFSSSMVLGRRSCGPQTPTASGFQTCSFQVLPTHQLYHIIQSMKKKKGQLSLERMFSAIMEHENSMPNGMATIWSAEKRVKLLDFLHVIISLLNKRKEIAFLLPDLFHISSYGLYGCGNEAPAFIN